MRPHSLAGGFLLTVALAGGICGAGDAPGIPLVWHVETPDGRIVATRAADDSINPASVVKVASSLWALERLGPDHRFETEFGYRGTLDRATGRLDGDLVVNGGGDPDFHVENAYLVARALNEAGLREVSGRLVVDDRFWIGWEGGFARRSRDPERRRDLMVERLAHTLDPDRWNDGTRRSIEALKRRRGADPAVDGRIAILGREIAGLPDEPPVKLLTHRSNPLHRLLKRLNAYSNNDIDRLESSLGPASRLAGELARRWRIESTSMRFRTYSGLGENRMSPAQIVRLLKDLRATCERIGLRVSDVLPVGGCDPGTLKNFPRLTAEHGALVGKTGTLTTTDQGIAVLAGIIHTRAGERLFSVAAPRTGRRPGPARDAQQTWLLAMAEAEGGLDPAGCGSSVVYSDFEAEIVAVATSAPAGP